MIPHRHKTGDSDDENGFGRLSEDDVRTFVRAAIWPQILKQLTDHYDADAAGQFSENVIFQIENAGRIALKRLLCGRTRDFRCITNRHANAQDTVQVFIDLRGGYKNTIWATLWSRCFARKCNSNAKQVHVSLKIECREV